VKPITAEQKREKLAYDQFQRAKSEAFRRYKGLDDALDYIFVALYQHLSGKPAKAKREPKLTYTDKRFGVYVSAIQLCLNYDAPKSEWRKREPGEVARALGFKLSLDGSRVFGNALRYALRAETAKTYLVPPVKNSVKAKVASRPLTMLVSRPPQFKEALGAIKN